MTVRKCTVRDGPLFLEGERGGVRQFSPKTILHRKNGNKIVQEELWGKKSNKCCPVIFSIFILKRTLAQAFAQEKNSCPDICPTPP